MHLKTCRNLLQSVDDFQAIAVCTVYVKISALFCNAIRERMTLPEQSTHQISKQLDTRGLRCPEPVMMLHQAIRKSVQGDVIEVLATDPSTSWDIPKFCMHLGHALLIQEEREFEGQQIYYYQVQKQ